MRTPRRGPKVRAQHIFSTHLKVDSLGTKVTSGKLIEITGGEHLGLKILAPMDAVEIYLCYI